MELFPSNLEEDRVESSTSNFYKIVDGLQELHQKTFGDPSIKIAIIDGSINTNHPCFAGANIHVHDLLQLDNSKHGVSTLHGTAVASIIFGQPSSSILGIAPKCSGLIIPIFKDNSKGKVSPASQTDLSRAINFALDQEVNIINISGGHLSDDGEADIFLKRALEKCKEKNVLVIAAAGNSGCRCLHIPAAIQSVLAVGSINDQGQPMGFSNWGDAYKLNGLLAPGEHLFAADVNTGTKPVRGTSFSTPIVSGIAALIMSYAKMKNIPLSGNSLKDMFLQSAIPCVEQVEGSCDRFLKGSLNLPQLIQQFHQKETPKTEIHPSHTSNLKIMEPPNESIETTELLLPSEVKELSNVQTQQSIDDTTVTVAESKEIKSKSKINIQKSDTIMENTTPNLPTAEVEKVNLDQQALLPSCEQSLELAEDGLLPSDCGCGGKKQEGAAPSAPQVHKGYVIGELGYDFISESHRDSFTQSMGGNSPHNPADLLTYLKANPWDAESIIWTLKIDSTPIYAIRPHGAYASNTYSLLLEFLEAQLLDNIERISIPGLVKGKVRLLSGLEVPAIFPTIRGMYGWSTDDVISSLSGTVVDQAQFRESLSNFLNRVYYEIRNLGISSSERAINYAATNAFQASEVFASTVNNDMELDSIQVVKSPICQPGSDCWDVKLIFFNPRERLTQARQVHRYTIDVSDIVPVTVGERRQWSIY